MVGAHKDRKMNLTQFPASGSSLSSRGSETGARVVMSRGGQCSELGERQINIGCGHHGGSQGRR